MVSIHPRSTTTIATDFYLSDTIALLDRREDDQEEVLRIVLGEIHELRTNGLGITDMRLATPSRAMQAHLLALRMPSQYKRRRCKKKYKSLKHRSRTKRHSCWHGHK